MARKRRLPPSLAAGLLLCLLASVGATTTAWSDSGTWVPIYSSSDDDFGSWQTNHPSEFYWDAVAGAYHYAISDAADDYAFVPVTYGGGSFRLEFDVLPTYTEWAGNFRLGLWDPAMEVETDSSIHAMYHLDDNGYHTICLAYYPGGSGGWTPGTHTDYADAQWYHNVIEYDAEAGEATFSFTRLADDLTLGGTISGIGAFSGLDRIAMTSIGDYGYPEATAEGYVKQVLLSVRPTTGVEVVIDIKPGNSHNPVNPKSEGVLPVAVFTSDDFDATDIDPSTVLLTGAPVAQNPDGGRWMIEEKDENGDGLMDVRMHFDTEGIEPALLVDGYAVLTGSTYGGISFYGSDTVTIVPQDLANDFWALEEIAECLDAGVALGYPDGNYRPSVPVARDQMAVFVSRAMAGGDEGVPEGPDEPTFSDVPRTQWAYDHVEYAAANGVVTGYGDGSYQPSWVVTRSQMAVFIARAKGWVKIGDEMTAAPQLFTDVPAGYWSGTAVKACVANGVVQGYPDGYYRPTGQVTRDQMAVYIARAFGL